MQRQVEQIQEIPVPQMAEKGVEVPQGVQRTVEQNVEVPKVTSDFAAAGRAQQRMQAPRTPWADATDSAEEAPEFTPVAKKKKQKPMKDADTKKTDPEGALKESICDACGCDAACGVRNPRKAKVFCMQCWRRSIERTPKPARATRASATSWPSWTRARPSSARVTA